MAKIKKVITGLICTVMVLSSALPVNAEPESRGSVAHCTQCGTGAVTVREISRVNSGTVYRRCPHGGNEVYDEYELYIVTHELSCNSCSFRKTESSPIYVLISCNK